MRGIPLRLGRRGRGSPCPTGLFSPRFPLLPFVLLLQTMAAPLSPTVVLGEASESDSEPEPGGTAAGTRAVGLKVPGEASETEEEEEEDGVSRVPLPGVSRGGTSLLQQRLGAGEGRLRGAMAEALGRGFSGAARLLEGLGGPLGQAQAGAAATAHCLCLVRRDLRAVAATVATVTTCRLTSVGCCESEDPGGAVLAAVGSSWLRCRSVTAGNLQRCVRWT